MESGIVGMGPWIGVISQIVGWTFFIIVLTMFKNFLTNGFSMAVAEFILKTNDVKTRQKLVRWFGNGDIILEHLKEMDEKMKKTKE